MVKAKDISIRRMTPDDAGDLIAAFDAMLPADWRDGPLPDASRMAEVLANEHLVVIAAFAEAAPAGYVSGFVLPALNNNGSVVMLDDLLVAESFRSQGLGRRLVEAFKVAAKKMAMPPVVMWSGTGVDNIACQKAFEATGAERVDEIYAEYEWEQLD